MDTISEQKDALIAMGLTAVGFVLLVATTAAFEYGLPMMPSDSMIWSVTRVVPAFAWISIACVLLFIRQSVVWTSAAAALAVALVVGFSAASILAPVGINPVSLMSSMTYYGLTTALLCVTVQNPLLAGLLAPVLLILQVVTDILAHLGTGVLQIAC